MSRKPDAWLVAFDVNEIIREAAGFIDGELESIANRIADEARGEEFPTSKTGKLVKGIRPRVSKFENGGWIVLVRVPHAHLVEYGHAMVNHDGTQPKITKHVPAHPFLRKAKDKVLMEAVAEFRSKYGKGA